MAAPAVLDVEQPVNPLLALSKNRYVQLGGVALVAVVLVALTVYALLRVPRIRDALQDVWPFKLMLQTARKKKPAAARPFYDESSCDENEASQAPQQHPPFSALSRIVMFSDTAGQHGAECAEGAGAVEVIDEPEALEEAPPEQPQQQQARATFSARQRKRAA
jgi:hypothetical protein